MDLLIATSDLDIAIRKDLELFLDEDEYSLKGLMTAISVVLPEKIFFTANAFRKGNYQWDESQGNLRVHNIEKLDLEEFKIIEHDDNYYHIELGDGRDGWIHESCGQKITETVEQKNIGSLLSDSDIGKYLDFSEKVFIKIEENFDKALELRQKEIQAHKKITTIKTKLKEQNLENPSKLTAKEIAAVISNITGIPISNIVTEEKKQFLNLEKILGSKIIGQPETQVVVDTGLRVAS